MLGFISFLLMPHLCKMLNVFPVSTEDENRTMAIKPEMDISHLDKYPKEYDNYFNDHFGLRSVGLKAYNNFNYFFLKKSPSPQKAILGKDGWLFQGKDINHYRGLERLSEMELQKLENEFKKRFEFLNKNNCRFIFVVVPSKKNIYPEYLPDGYFRFTDKTITDQLVEMLKTRTKIEVIDLRPVIKEAKNEHPVLYHKMDNHWNDIASFYACKKIIDYLDNSTSIGKFHSYNEYKLDTTTYYGGSIARMLGVQDKMIDYRLKLQPKFKNTAVRLPQRYKSPDRFPYPGSYERRFEVSNDSLPRLMMINDSFGEYFYRFLPEYFSYSIFLFDSWEFKLHAQKVLNEQPDIFIIATFEGFIKNILDNLNRPENQVPDTFLSKK